VVDTRSPAGVRVYSAYLAIHRLDIRLFTLNSISDRFPTQAIHRLDIRLFTLSSISDRFPTQDNNIINQR
jgi:hypothetical protein